MQKAAFPEVIKQLTNYETSTEAMKNKSAPYAEKGKLKKLHPVLINNLLRVGGRLCHSVLSEEAKHPIILPKESHFTLLVIDHYHREAAHLGAHVTLSGIRQRF